MSGTPSGPGQERRWVLHVDMDQFVAATRTLAATAAAEPDSRGDAA